MKQKKMLGLAALALGAMTLAGTPRVMADDAKPVKEKKEKAVKPKYDADAMLKKLTANLTLTQEEQDKIKPIVTDEATQLNGLDATLTKEQKAEKVKTIRSAANDQISALLTPEQKAKFEKHKPKAKEAPKTEAPKP